MSPNENGSLSAIRNSFASLRRALNLFVCSLVLVCLAASAVSAQDTRTVTEPQFPSTICQTLDANLQAVDGVFYGYDETLPGNSAPDTARLQAAITACASTSQVNVVELRASGSNNAFLIGPITLTNGVVLLIDPGVTLYGSRRGTDYGSNCPTSGGGNCSNLISGSAFNNGGIMGYGVIDGRGNKTLIGNTLTWWDPTYENGARPRLINLTNATNFTLYKITFRNSPKFHFYLQNSGTNGITAWGIKITAPYDSPNTDGFDPTGSNLTLKNSFISVGDDEVAIKGGSTVNAHTYQHNYFYSGHGMSVGSETNGNVTNVYVTDLMMHGDVYDTNNNGLRLKSDSSRGGIVQGLLYDGVCIKDTDHPLVFDAYYSTSTGSKYPDFRDVKVRNVHILNDPNFNYFSSSKNIVFRGYDATRPLNITLDNVILEQPTYVGQYISQNTNYTLGPGPVTFGDLIPSMSPNTNVTVTDNRSTSPAPYDCTNKWQYLATELFASPNQSGTINITTSQTLPLMVILQPIVSSDPLPNGTVTILDGTNTLSTVPLSTTGWLTQVPITGLTPGTHVLTAHFSGDSTVTKYGPLDFGSVTVNVTSDTGVATTTQLSSTTSSIDAGNSLQLTATVTATSGTPSGAVDFFEGSTLLGSATLDASGVATIAVNTLQAGLHNLTASYYGATGFTSSSSAVYPVTVTAATTTTLTASASDLTQGTALTLTAAITSGFGTPATGTVTFYDGGNSIGTGTVDATGKATFTSSSFSSGSHSFTATFAPVVGFYGSTSTVVNVSVNAPTTTTLMVSPNPAISNNTVTMTATVTSAGGTPTGSVTFSDYGNTLGTATLNGSGVATFTTSFTGTGLHSITATYLGTTGFATSGSSAVTLNVAAATITTLSATPNPVASGSTLTLTATITAGILTPPAGGTVTFFDGATSIGTATTNASGVATLTTSTLSGGTHSITAVYAGTTGYATSTSAPVSVVVTGGNVSTSVALTATPSATTTYGLSLTLTATVTPSSGPAPSSGNVTFSDGGVSLGSVAVNASGVATLTTSTLSVGPHSMTATYGGTTGFDPSNASPALAVTVNAAPTTTVISASPISAVYGSTITVTATVTSSGGTPTGSVSIYDDSGLLGTATLNASGVATFTTSTLSATAHSIYAVYGATTNFATSTSARYSVSITPAGTSTALNVSPAGPTYGSSVTLTATVTSAAGTPPGSVSFYDGSTLLGTGTLNASGVATLTTSSLSVATHSLTATYGATTNYGSSTSAVSSLTVSPAGTTTALTVSPASPTYGASVTLTATVTSGAGTPSGTVNFFDGSTLLGSASLNGSGVATFTTSSLSVATHSLTAVYVATTNFAGSTSTASSVTVSPASTTTTLSASPTSTVYGSSITLTATVTSGAGTPSGSVSFYDGATLLGTGTLNGSGVATFSTSALSVAVHSLTATYGATTNFASSTSSAQSVTVSTASTTTSLTASSTSPAYGASVTFTATVTSTAGTPTGTVSFYDGATLLGTGTLSSGVATYSTSSLSSGAHSVTATYGATTAYASSTSAAVAVTVAAAPDFTVTANPNTVTVAIGGTGNTTLTLTPQNGFNGSVTLGCAGLPSYVTCSFLPTSPVAVNGSAVQVQMTVRVASTVAGLQQRSPFLPMSLPAMFAFLPLMMLGGKNKRSAKILIGLFVVLMLMACVGCGGGSTNTNPGPSKPPTGTQTVTVNAASGSTTHPLNLTINITN